MYPERMDALLEKNEVALERYRWVSRLVDSDDKFYMIADVGCGPGYGASMIYQYSMGTVVIGFDVSREAQKHAAKHYREIPVILCNAEAQTFVGFSLVVCLEALSHFIDPYTWIKNLDVPRIVLSMPLIKSKSVYPWRKHEIPEAVFREMIEPKWKIKDELRQAQYLTLYAEQ
jgi:SAM-dependent methyltransferase